MRATTSVVGMLAAALALTACKESGEMAILDVQPRKGNTQGESPVRIIGKNFRQDIGYTVYFGNKKAQELSLQDPETMVVTTPASMPVGTVDIMIRADNGNAFKISQVYSFEQVGPQKATGAAAEQKGNLAY